MNTHRTTEVEHAARRQGARAAVCTMLGIVLSGPASWLLLALLAPQPAWESAANFAEHFHPAQNLPYVAGFFLVAGYVGLLASLRTLAAPRQEASANVALVFTAVYAALIVFNYLVQTTFVPTLAMHFAPANALALSMWSMSNPRSLAWGVELWGYACLGIATWFVAPIVRHLGDRGRSAALTFRLNGVVSVVTAGWMMFSPGWAMTPAGLVAYVLWNVLAFAMSWLAFDVLRAERSVHAPPAPSASESAA
jgi:hypothetical protein